MRQYNLRFNDVFILINVIQEHENIDLLSTPCYLAALLLVSFPIKHLRSSFSNCPQIGIL